MEILYKELENSFRYWSNTDKAKLILDLDDFYKKNFRLKKVIKMQILNNKLYYENEHLEGVFNNLFLDRSKHIIKLFEIALERLNKQKIKLRDFTFYFTINDYNITKQLPIFAFSKQFNSEGILIPDWTFINLVGNKVKNNWDDIKESLARIKIKNKEDIIFFQGANTSKIIRDIREYKSDIRENIKLLSKENNNFIVKIDEPLSPITEWVKYKYLLDLPGAYPWSVRFKELLMMKSIVIKVDIKNPWINFYSALLKPNIDYIQIKYDNNDEPINLANGIYNKIVKVYKYLKHKPKKVNDMINSAYKNINKLTMDGVINYLVLVLKLSEKLLHIDIANKNKTKKNIHKIHTYKIHTHKTKSFNRKV
jgi:hypothetical protein